MAKTNGPKRQSPSGPPPSLQKSTSGSQSSMNQKSILGFFQKSSHLPTRTPTSRPTQSLTPAASSDAPEPPTSPDNETGVGERGTAQLGLPSPITPVSDSGEVKEDLATQRPATLFSSSPSRKAKKAINYAESADEEDEDEGEIFKPTCATSARSRAAKRARRSTDEDSLEDFAAEEIGSVDEDEDLDDFIVPDDSDEEVQTTKKRKRPSKGAASKGSAAKVTSRPVREPEDSEMPTVSGTASQWTYNPDDVQPYQPRPEGDRTAAKPKANDKKHKQKAHTSEPEQRYPWLAD
ncbi:MAG: DNA mismatch repair protein msh6, partial [Thelocarpon superellum]